MDGPNEFCGVLLANVVERSRLPARGSLDPTPSSQLQFFPPVLSLPFLEYPSLNTYKSGYVYRMSLVPVVVGQSLNRRVRPDCPPFAIRGARLRDAVVHGTRRQAGTANH